MNEIDPEVTDLIPTPGRDCAHAVLVLRALGLGDALTGIAALRGIRRAWPDRFIALAAPAPVGRWLRQLGVVDEVLVTERLAPVQWPPTGWIGVGGHLAVNLHGRGPRSHRVLSTTAPDDLIAFRCPLATHLTGPTWRRDEHEVDRWCRLISGAGGPCDANDLRLPSPGPRGDYVVIHPGAASGSRRWPPERWAWLAARLVAAGDRVVISGGESERELCQHVVRQLPADGAVDRSLIQVEAGTKDLPELAELIARATLLICGDTGIAHLATAFGTPSVLLFGPTAPSWWGPRIDQQRHTVLWSAAPGYRGDPHADAVDPALLALSPEEVLDAADSMLDSLRRGARRAERTTPPSGQARQAS